MSEQVERDWNLDQLLTVAQGKEVYKTRDVIVLLTNLLEDGYTALGMGLIIDLIAGELEEVET